MGDSEEYVENSDNQGTRRSSTSYHDEFKLIHEARSARDQSSSSDNDDQSEDS